MYRNFNVVGDLDLINFNWFKNTKINYKIATVFEFYKDDIGDINDNIKILQ